MRTMARSSTAGANAEAVFQVQDENLAVTDFSGAGNGLDGIDSDLDELVVDGDFQLHFGDEAKDDLSTTELLRVTALPAAAVNVGDGHEKDFFFVQRVLNGR